MASAPAAQAAALLAIQAALDPAVPIEPVSRDTPEENRLYLQHAVLGNDGLLRHIVSFISIKEEHEARRFSPYQRLKKQNQQLRNQVQQLKYSSKRLLLQHQQQNEQLQQQVQELEREIEQLRQNQRDGNYNNPESGAE